MGILAFLIILTVLVIVHEIGHFFTARKFGIAVEEFGFGLPPRAIGKKIGDTIYSLNWVPLGGFVRIKGEQGETPNEPDSFASHPVWQRALVISAGVIMNFLLAGVLLTIGYVIGTPQIIEGDQTGTITNQEVRVAALLDGYPARTAGIEQGDVFISIDGKDVESVIQVQKYISESAATSKSVQIVIERGGEVSEKVIETATLADEERAVIGVELIATGIVAYPVHISFIKGFESAILLLRDIAIAFGQVIRDIFVGEKVTVDLAGPVGIAVITNEVAALGFAYIIQFAAILSINLAIINFMPFPALDGGRFWFLMAEKIKGSPVNQKVEALIHNVGFAFLITLIILITIRDLSNLNFWERVSNIL